MLVWLSRGWRASFFARGWRHYEAYANGVGANGVGKSKGFWGKTETVRKQIWFWHVWIISRALSFSNGVAARYYPWQSIRQTPNLQGVGTSTLRFYCRLFVANLMCFRVSRNIILRWHQKSRNIAPGSSTLPPDLAASGALAPWTFRLFPCFQH